MTPPLLPELLSERQPIVEQALRASLDLPADRGLPLYRMMRYQLGWVDQMGEERSGEQPRILGGLCLEAHDALSAHGMARSATASSTAEDASSASEGAAPASAAIELFGESVRVHEDMQTATQQRAGQDAVWWVWGPAQAINVGDGLHAVARLTLFHAQEALGVPATLAAVAALDAAALEYYEGQYLDLQLQERVDVTVQQYMRMARGKHGAIFGGALALGAIAAGASEDAVRAWRDAGAAVGVGALIANEARVLWGEGEDAGRALNKSKLYPVVVALAEGTLSQKRELGGHYFKRVMEPSDLDGIRNVLEAAGARTKTEQAMIDAKAQALDAFDAADAAPDAMERWAAITDALVSI